VVVSAVFFVIVGGANLEIGPVEARTGLAAFQGFTPIGQIFGGWEPSLWPAQFAPSVLWSWTEWGIPSTESIRWPAAIAAVAIGLILARRVAVELGPRAASLTALSWFGSVALIDRSGGAGIDLLTALGTIAALDGLINRRSHVITGLWASWAFLAGGWPPLAVILLAAIVVARRETGLLPLGLWTPVVVTVAGWSAWTLAVAPAEVWAAALALPLTAKFAWGFPLKVIALGLPWSPFAAWSAASSVRDGWPPRSRSLVLSWLQIAGAMLLGGTLIPGLALAATLPALAGLAIVAAACADRIWTGATSPTSRRSFQVAVLAVALIWGLIAIAGGGYLAAAVGYYRSIGVVVAVLGGATALVALTALLKANPRSSILALIILAVSLKIAHWGYYVPEWNYRRSQGPWGRAIGQWMPPHWPIYSFHSWPADLAFATQHPFRQLAAPALLAHQEGTFPRFVLLLDSEFEHWPKDAPAIVKVASFQDERGRVRILARTAGDLSYREIARSRHASE
jgi:hypothetical protein